MLKLEVDIAAMAEKRMIMAVGKSGVGKSTIGNFLLTGCPTAPHGEGFQTSTGVTSCTQNVSWVSSDKCSYGDVPGIPDTDPTNTRDFYDMIVKEARSGLHVILFVFKKDRIDVAVYERAKLLFREFQEHSTVPKFLVINDHTNYGFNQPPTEAELKKQADEISNTISIKFDAIFYLNTSNMQDKIKLLLTSIGCFTRTESPGLKTYDELETWIDTMQNNKTFIEASILESRSLLVNTLEGELAVLRTSAKIARGTARVQQAIGSFLSFGLSPSPICDFVVDSADQILLAIEIKEIQLANGRAALENALTHATKDLENAITTFDEFKKALGPAKSPAGTTPKEKEENESDQT